MTQNSLQMTEFYIKSVIRIKKEIKKAKEKENEKYPPRSTFAQKEFRATTGLPDKSKKLESYISHHEHRMGIL